MRPLPRILRPRFLRPVWRLLPGSLLGRLALAFAVVGGASMALGIGVLHHTLDEVVWRTHVANVMASSAAIADRLETRGATGLLAALPEETLRRFDSVTGSMRFAVLGPEGNLLSASPGARPALPRLDAMGDAEEVFRLGADGSELWGLSRQVITPQGEVTLQVAQDMGRAYVVLDDVVRGAIGPVVWVLAAGAVLLFVVNVGSVLLLLGPLRRAAADAARIRPGGTRRLVEGAVPAEARPLIRAVNGALDRQDEALARQRAFSQDVAHELRTPLAILLTEVELLEDTEAGERLRHDIEGLVRLVNQLLEAAEATGRRPARMLRCDLLAICRNVAQRLAGSATEHGVRVTIIPPDEPRAVIGDAEALARAVRNLVENAIGHSPPGSDVEIRLPEPGLVEVADRGPGVPHADRDRIFRRFVRADNTNRPGTGLGLAIVDGIARAHGGGVAVHDNPGGGAVFVLSLTPAPAPVEEPTPAAEADPALTMPAPV